MAADFDKLREIFLSAVEQHRPEEWDAYLDQACAADAELRRQAAALLKAHAEGGGLPDVPASPSDETGIHQPLAERPGAMIGPYKLIEQIGEGGMGTVWMAQQTEPVKRLVAIKLIKAGMDSRQVIARFEAERQALALMDHPNIARVFDGGTTDGRRSGLASCGEEATKRAASSTGGRPYFVMELVKGVPITRYCDEHRLTPRQRLELFVPICQAVQHAHQKGIIHRDLKPSNVLVALYDGKPVPKVIDFGVAKATGQSLTDKTLVTGFGAIVGTLEYMSPEQAEVNQLDIDTRSDIYALGVLLYELLAGSPPFSRKELEKAGLLEMLRVIREQEPSKPSTKLSTAEGLPTLAANRGTEPAKLTRLVRGELDWIVMKALEKDRNRRYETANGFAIDVQRYLADEPVQACPPSAGYRFRKFARRNKVALAIAALILFFVAILGGGGGWVMRDRLTREAALDYQVDLALDEASELIKDGKWPEAQTAVQRAEKLLVAAGRTDLPQRLQDLREDAIMAQRLEDIYSRPENEEFLWGQEQDKRYAEEFERYGIDVLRLPAVQAAEQIRARSIRLELARALDFWSSRRRAAGNQKPPDWKHLVEIAQAVDPDPWRVQWRKALGERDRKALEALAASADVRQLPQATLYLLGPALHEVGARDLAMALLRQAQRQYPEDWWINNILGWYCLTASPPEFDDAIRYYTAAQAVRPRNPYNLKGLGDALAGKKAYAEALATFSRVIELKPDYREAWNERGGAYYELHQYEKAIADWCKAIELDPKNAVAWNNRGYAYTQLHQYHKAFTDLNKAIELDPKNAPAWNNRGLAYCELHQYDKALAELNKAIELDSNYAPAWNNRGATHNELHQYEKAVADLNKAIELDPKNAPAWNNRGRAYMELQQYEKAVANLNKAIELDPKNAVAWHNRGQSYIRLHQYDKAPADLNNAIELDAKNAVAWNDRGLAYFELHQYDKALADLNKAIELDSNYTAAWNNRGATHYELRQYDKAVADLNKAIELDPKNVPAWNNRGRAYSQLKQWDKASADFAKAIELNPKDAHHRLYRGDTYAEMSQWPSADADFTKVTELVPTAGNAWYKHALLRLHLADTDGYRQTCARMVENFGRTKEAVTADMVAWTCVLAPHAVTDLERPVQLAEMAVRTEPKTCRCLATLGAALYRAGQFDEAIKRLSEANAAHKPADEERQPIVYHWLFLAMTQHRLGHAEEARYWLDKATREIGHKAWDAPRNPTNTWNRRVTLQLLRREAEEVLEIREKKK